MTVKDAIKELGRHSPDTPCAMAIWLPEDVQTEGEEFYLTDEEVAEVLRRVHKNQAADLGINWETIHQGVVEVVADRK